MYKRQFPRAATRDAARVLGHDYGTGDRLAKLIPDPIMGRPPSFEDCLKPGEPLREAYDEDKDARAILDVAQGLEGIVRNSSIHAAAVVIAGVPLTDVVPLQLADSNETDDQGNAVLPVYLPQIEDPHRPLEARVTIRVAEGSGRPVERQVTKAVASADPMIGVKSLFDGVAPEGGEARFQIIAVEGDTAVDLPVKWTVSRVEYDYQWYQSYGNWSWEPVVKWGATTLIIVLVMRGMRAMTMTLPVQKPGATTNSLGTRRAPSGIRVMRKRASVRFSSPNFSRNFSTTSGRWLIGTPNALAMQSAVMSS